jgi:hypothetical protein
MNAKFIWTCKEQDSIEVARVSGARRVLPHPGRRLRANGVASGGEIGVKVEWAVMQVEFVPDVERV